MTDKDKTTESSNPLNLFIFGANAGREKSKGKSIISQFAESCSDQANTLVFDGTGGSATYKNKFRLAIHQAAGIMGFGVDATVNNALAQIVSKNPLPSCINMFAYSRGATTCQRIAYQLNKIMPNIPVRMLLLDPVAGLTNKSDTSVREIHGNVKECIVFASQHERREIMTMQDRIRRTVVVNPEQTALFHLPIYGQHSDSDYETANEKTNPIPRIIWQTAYDFFTEGGTKFKDDEIPKMIHRSGDKFTHVSIKPKTTSEKLSDYDKLREHKAYHEARQSRSIGTKDRSFLRNLDSYVVGGFINQQERELCKSCYPNAFNYLCERGIGADSKSEDYLEDVTVDLEGMSDAHPNLFKMFDENFGLVNADNKIKLPDQPQGLELEETSPLTNSHTVAQTTQHNLSNVIIAACRYYQRERHYSFLKRTHHSLADQIIRNVEYIMKDKKADKIERTLAAVNTALDSLRRSNSKSDLLHNLEFVIQKRKPLERPRKNILMRVGVRFFSLTGLNKIISHLTTKFKRTAVAHTSSISPEKCARFEK